MSGTVESFVVNCWQARTAGCDQRTEMLQCAFLWAGGWLGIVSTSKFMASLGLTRFQDFVLNISDMCLWHAKGAATARLNEPGCAGFDGYLINLSCPSASACWPWCLFRKPTTETPDSVAHDQSNLFYKLFFSCITVEKSGRQKKANAGLFWQAALQISVCTGTLTYAHSLPAWERTF